MKFYVAGASSELPRVRAFMAALTEMGHSISHDWTIPVEEHGAREHALTVNEARGFACTDLEGISEADILVLLGPENSSIGAWIEFGFALFMSLNLDRGTIWVGPRRSVFWAVADVVIDTDAEALFHIRAGSGKLRE